MKFSLRPVLLGGESLSTEAKQALRENRIKDAVDLLMVEDGLNCAEAGHLLDRGLRGGLIGVFGF